jgi:hypothetical protein
VALADVAEGDDLAAPVDVLLYVDVGPELVGEPEAVGHPERLEVANDVGGWIVVVQDADLERHLRQACDRFRGDPGDGCD